MTETTRKKLKKFIKQFEKTGVVSIKLDVDKLTEEEFEEFENNLCNFHSSISDLYNEIWEISDLNRDGPIQLSYDQDINEEALSGIGVDINLVRSCLKEIDYCKCSIKFDNEYHLVKDLDKATKKLSKHLDKFGLEYQIN